MVRQFDRSFTEIQFLLNTSSGADNHLKRGLRQANHQLRNIESETRLPRLDTGWPKRLTHSERKRLLQQLVELMMLEARGRVTLARRHGSETDRGDAIRYAIGRLTEAESIDPNPPAALYEERARYHAAARDGEPGCR